MFQAQVHCAKIVLKNTNRHLSSTPCSHVPSSFPYVDCITVKKIFSRLLKQIFIAVLNILLIGMLLQFKLHFTASRSSSHDINAAPFTTTITDYSGPQIIQDYHHKSFSQLPFHHMSQLPSVSHCGYSSFGTWFHTRGEVKGKLVNGVGNQYSHATTERGLSSITQADAHTSAASSRLNRRPYRFKWTRPFRGKTKSGFCACTITFRTSYTRFIKE